jgi:hypothetical protein
MKKKSLFKIFAQSAIVLPILFSVIFSSCYTDYGLDSSTNYDVVITKYQPDFNFTSVGKYYLVPTVQKVGGTTTTDYDSQILSTTKANLDALGWAQITDSTTAIGTPNCMYVSTGITTVTTTDVSCGYDPWGYYGGWYYPDYYCGYSYTYTTGTVMVLMAPQADIANGGTVGVVWGGVVNGLTQSSGGSTGGTVNQRITTTLNQAFTQSPYLKGN